ncbi:MAG: dephospho-CoA kinase [Actinobacteria bacterium]|nr:dephospho-CoA kinase [Actinomycetota bacterium]
MLVVGLTGGIGSGKSSVASMLSERGAVILDADAFARAAVAVGTPALARVAARFGAEVLGSDGELDRSKLAGIVFQDEASLRDLEAIVHPEVRRMIADGLAANAGTPNVVVVESPLLFEMGTDELCDVVVVVVADPETRISRLVARGMTEVDARARLSSQAPQERTAQGAGVVLGNDGALEGLRDRVERLWRDLRSRTEAPEVRGAPEA